jgi:hypothetical protein
MTEEQRSPTGKPMVPSTPMDVIRIRIASFVLVFCVAIGILSGVGRLWWLTAIVAVIVAITALSMVFAVKKQRRLGGGPESRG